MQIGHVRQGSFLDNRHRLIFRETTFQFFLHDWDQRIVSATGEDVSSVQRCDMRLLAINVVDTLIGAVGPEAGEIEEHFVEEGPIAFDGHR